LTINSRPSVSTAMALAADDLLAGVIAARLALRRFDRVTCVRVSGISGAIRSHSSSVRSDG
jgi:hypothetical protein